MPRKPTAAEIDATIAEWQRKGLIACAAVTAMEARGNTATIAIPPTSNNLFLTRGRKRIKTAQYRQWIEANGPRLRSMQKATVYPVEVRMTIYGGKGFRTNSDIANREKAATDLLVSCGILIDDSVKFVRKTTAEYVPPASKADVARCVLEIIGE